MNVYLNGFWEVEESLNMTWIKFKKCNNEKK